MHSNSISQLISEAYEQLCENPQSTRLEAEILLAYCLGKPRSYLRTWPHKVLDYHQINDFKQLVERRVGGEPIAYITGQREFWSLNLQVTPATLIPRPETERLVELALTKIPLQVNFQIADLGTGSGAVAIALASERPLSQVLATDTSSAALSIAKKNLERVNIPNVELIKSHWFDALANRKFDIVVSNPPYVAAGDPHLNNGDLRFEPLSALVSGEDGLDDIRCIVVESTRHLNPGGWLLIEHGYNQGDDVVHLLNKAGFQNAECVADLGQRERISLGYYG